jgi:type VI secretion system protein ImpG
MHPHDDHLEYYRRELDYLRTQAADFAARYPKVARRLVLSGTEAADPHTEHLIASVAFLTARVHRELDRDFPIVAAAMLENLCPSLTQPVPAMTVMQMTLDPLDGKVTAGTRIARGTRLSTTAATGEPCRFQVGWDTTLWPLAVTGVTLENARTLRLDIQADAGVDLADLEVATLRLHLAGELLTTMPLHDLLLASLDAIDIDSTAGVHRLPAVSLAEAGFGPEESLLASPAHAHPAYGLLQQYFAFPRAFQFFDVGGLRGCLGTGSQFVLRLIFSHGADVLALLRPEHIRLNCVPAMNLFAMTSEPIAWDRRQYEYLLVPSRRHDATTEIHSIVAVTLSDPRSERKESIPSLYLDTGGAGDLDHVRGNAPLAWTMRRSASLRPGIHGSDVHLALVDRGDATPGDATPVLFASLLCTNRQLASQVVPGTRFYGEGVAKSTVIRALYQPSAQRAPAMDSQALWALVALLRLNHRSLVDGSAGVATLRDMLELFASDSARDAIQIRGIRQLTASAGTARIGSGTGWRGHCRGTDIVLEFHRDDYAGASALMLASVLARFFALYTSANAFVRLRVVRGGETWMSWPPMTGRQVLL